MKSHNTPLLILDQKPLGEKHRSLIVYSDQFGKIRLTAKGAQSHTSRMIGHLQPLNYCEASLYFGPKNIILTEIHTLENFEKIKCDLTKIACAMQTIEATRSLLLDEQALPGLLSQLLKTLHEIAAGTNPHISAMGYIIKLLDAIGVIPALTDITSQTHQKYFQFFEFLRTRPHAEIRRLVLKPAEQNQSYKLLKQIIERETEREMRTMN